MGDHHLLSMNEIFNGDSNKFGAGYQSYGYEILCETFKPIRTCSETLPYFVQRVPHQDSIIQMVISMIYIIAIALDDAPIVQSSVKFRFPGKMATKQRSETS
jgi:hypothetical protein